jgi:hypothetical protein
MPSISTHLFDFSTKSRAFNSAFLFMGVILLFSSLVFFFHQGTTLKINRQCMKTNEPFFTCFDLKCFNIKKKVFIRRGTLVEINHCLIVVTNFHTLCLINPHFISNLLVEFFS